MSKSTLVVVLVALFVGLGSGLVIRTMLREDGHSNHSRPTSKPAKQQDSSDAVTESRPTPEVSIGSGNVIDIENKLCPVMENPVKPDSFSITYNGMLVRFCCPGCDSKFLEEPVHYLKLMKEGAAKVPDEKLSEESNPKVILANNKRCPVKGGLLGESKLYVVHNGVRLGICCEDCRGEFSNKPDHFLSVAAKDGDVPSERLHANHRAKRNEAKSTIVDIKNQVCPVMENPVKPDSFSIDYNGLLVRFCCPGCDTKFLNNPVEYLTSIKEQGAAIPEGALTSTSNPKVVDANNAVCPVMNREVGDSKLYVVFQGVRIRLCCDDCRETFSEDPEKYLELAAKSGQVPADRLQGGAK